MWDLLRTLWQRHRFVSETFGVPLSMVYEHFTCQFTPHRFPAVRMCSASFHANSRRRYVNRKQYQVCTRLTVTFHCLRDTSNCLTAYLFNDAQCLKTLPNTQPSNATKHVPYRDTENPSASHEITGFYYIQSFRAVFTKAPNLNQVNLVPKLIPYFFRITCYIQITLASTPKYSTRLFSFRIPARLKFYMHLPFLRS